MLMLLLPLVVKDFICWHNLKSKVLAVITHSIIVSPILYALPAWEGFLTVELQNRINAFFKRLKRFGYMIITLIGTKSRSLFDLCMNILNRIVGY